MVEDPNQWSKEKIEQVEANLAGMRRKFDETQDPNLQEGIHKVEEELRTARGSKQ